MRWNRCLPALALLLFLPARADGPPPTVTPTPKEAAKKIAKKPAASKTPAPGAANMVVTRDPETGELRNATAAEREKLFGRRPLASPERKVVTLPDGSLMVELGEADMSYAVATRNPDGTITKTCVHGDAEAGKAASSPAPAPTKPADR